MKPHRAAIILVYGILGLMLCQLFGIAAWSMGTADLKAMNDGEMDRSGYDLTKAGRICGMVATGIFAFQIIACVIVGIAMVASRH